MDEPMEKDNLPVPFATTKTKWKRSKAKKEMFNELAAMGYVAMENGEYKYGDDSRKHYDADGNLVPNKAEVMRLAGYSKKSVCHFDDYLAKDENFWELVNLHRLRRSDPMFRKEQESRLWQEIGGEALRHLYERVMYFGHSMSVSELRQVLETILKAGITMQKMGVEADNKTDKLLESLPVEQREKAMAGYEDKLRRELEQLETLKGAHRAADKESA